MKRTLPTCPSIVAAGVLLAAALLGSGPLPAAEGLEARTERLEALRAEIEQVTAGLRSDRQRESDLDAELARLEREIGAANTALDRLAGRIDNTQTEVARLRKSHEAQSERLASQREFLARQVRAAYMTGGEPYLRLLLSQEDPDRIDRLLVYYDYLNRARADRIREAVTALTELRDLRVRLETELTRLESLHAERQRQRAALAQRRDRRAALRAELHQRIREGDQRLERLEADEKRLVTLLEKLQRALADVPDDLGAGESFPARRGTLAWPVNGKLVARFGSPRFAGIHWTGVMIDAAAGTPVHAVSHGRVVFADWLRGLGLLLIIDHGDGYMTLYGHNQSLYKEVGDWVQPGEVIATVGNSGGGRRNALYFEVRANGKPVDPLAWLRPAPQPG